MSKSVAILAQVDAKHEMSELTAERLETIPSGVPPVDLRAGARCMSAELLSASQRRGLFNGLRRAIFMSGEGPRCPWADGPPVAGPYPDEAEERKQRTNFSAWLVLGYLLGDDAGHEISCQQHYEPHDYLSDFLICAVHPDIALDIVSPPRPDLGRTLYASEMPGYQVNTAAASPHLLTVFQEDRNVRAFFIPSSDSGSDTREPSVGRTWSSSEEECEWNDAELPLGFGWLT